MGMALSTITAGAAPFANGDLESPGIAVGVGPVTYFGGSNLASWTVTWNTIAYGRTGAVYQGQVVAAFDGVYAVDITGQNFERGGGLEQTFDVLPSRRYRISFAVGRFSSNLPLMSGISTVGVHLNGVDLGTFTNDIVSATYTWRPHSIEFQTAPGSTSATLRLFDANSGGPTTHVGLDGMAVELLPLPTVPVVGLGGSLSLLLLSVITATRSLAPSGALRDREDRRLRPVHVALSRKREPLRH